jgi:hypothetical protein
MRSGAQQVPATILGDAREVQPGQQVGEVDAPDLERRAWHVLTDLGGGRMALVPLSHYLRWSALPNRNGGAPHLR